MCNNEAATYSRVTNETTSQASFKEHQNYLNNFAE